VIWYDEHGEAIADMRLQQIEQLVDFAFETR
jgi:hypothetical protein